ncbi:MAG: hypothetical protein ACI8ZB_003316 [Desulforhopalus sp.]|jgi:hypothetical protein
MNNRKFQEMLNTVSVVIQETIVLGNLEDTTAVS